MFESKQSQEPILHLQPQPGLPKSIKNFYRIVNGATNKDNRYLQFIGKTNDSLHEVVCRPLTMQQHQQDGVLIMGTEQNWIFDRIGNNVWSHIRSNQARTQSVFLTLITGVNSHVQCREFSNKDNQLWKIQRDHGRWFRIRSKLENGGVYYLEVLEGNNGLGNGSYVIGKPRKQNQLKQLWSFDPVSYIHINQKCLTYDYSKTPMEQSSIVKSNKWSRSNLPDGVIKYYFLEDGSNRGTAEDKQVVKDSFQQWKSIGINISFEETKNRNESHIRISFQKGDGCFSYLGNNNLNIKKTQKTMNLGWVSDNHWSDAIHQIGHALGLIHEHQHPSNDFAFHQQKVKSRFNLSKQEFQANFGKYKADELDYTTWDVNSIMIYEFSPSLIKKPYPYTQIGIGMPTVISERDKQLIVKYYGGKW